MRTIRLCKLPECSEKHFGKGYCNTHYQRNLRHGDPNKVKFQRSPLSSTDEENFASKVAFSMLCWNWKASTDNGGYGLLRLKDTQKLIGAHRYSYELYKGNIPKGMLVDHLCHNTSCVNPKHLRLANQKQNRENYSKVPKNNSSGYLGVFWLKDRAVWMSRVKSNKKVVHREIHPTYELHVAAHSARIARAIHHTYNINDRR